MNGLGFWFPVPIHAVPQSLEGGVDAALDQSAGQQAEPTHDVGDLTPRTSDSGISTAEGLGCDISTARQLTLGTSGAAHQYAAAQYLGCLVIRKDF